MFENATHLAEKDRCAVNGCEWTRRLVDYTHARSAAVFYWEIYTLGVIYRNQ